MSNQKQSFLDPKTIFAIVLSAIVFMLWNTYLQKKYPQQSENKTVVEKPVDNVNTAPIEETKKVTVEKESDVSVAKTAIVVPEKEIVYESDNVKYVFTNRGLGLKQVVLKSYKDRALNVKTFSYSNSPLPYETNLVGKSKPLVFDLVEQNDNKIVGVSQSGSVKIKKIIIIDSSNYSLKTQILVTGNLEDVVGIVNILTDKVFIPKNTSFLPASQFDAQQVFVDLGSSDEREIIDPEEVITKTFNRVSIASIGEQYFAQALIDRSKVLPDFKVFPKRINEKTTYLVGSVEHPILDKSKNLDIEFIYYLGPKSLSHLSAVDENLQKLIDFGIFGFLARPLLYLLKWLESFVQNWGFAIIILTIIVRLLVLPLHMMSFKSMKNMQRVSPLIKELNEKYKDEPQAKSQAMMQIYKENKINPLGGCLPMLLQIPVFFALYQVIGQSIELYQAPFALWIHDLSLKDPYYILPVLMGITMFFQMKLTPSTMDPTQAKIMMFMPLMFSVFMLSLPSGLTLYFFISGIFAIIQQYSMKDRSGQLSTKPVSIKN